MGCVLRPKGTKRKGTVSEGRLSYIPSRTFCREEGDERKPSLARALLLYGWVALWLVSSNPGKSKLKADKQLVLSKQMPCCPGEPLKRRRVTSESFLEKLTFCGWSDCSYSLTWQALVRVGRRLVNSCCNNFREEKTP